MNNIIVHNENKDTVRINKFLSSKGLCSRREADKIIESGRVKVNGAIATLGTVIGPNDEVRFDNKIINEKQADKPVYIALNKPVGIVCTTDKREKDNIVDFMKYPVRIFNIGRLDKESEGLLLMTNDGDIVNKILRARNNHEKEYVVTVDKPITPEFIKKMSNGVPILDTVTRKCFVKRESKHTFRIILTQGLNRQIRRMCEYLGYRVTKLKRERIMNIHLGDLPVGKHRNLTKQELTTLNSLISDSKKIFE